MSQLRRKGRAYKRAAATKSGPRMVWPLTRRQGSDMPSKDSFKSKSTLTAAGKTYTYYSLEAAAKAFLAAINRFALGRPQPRLHPQLP